MSGQGNNYISENTYYELQEVKENTIYEEENEGGQYNALARKRPQRREDSVESGSKSKQLTKKQ